MVLRSTLLTTRCLRRRFRGLLDTQQKPEVQVKSETYSQRIKLHLQHQAWETSAIAEKKNLSVVVLASRVITAAEFTIKGAKHQQVVIHNNDSEGLTREANYLPQMLTSTLASCHLDMQTVYIRFTWHTQANNYFA